MEADTGGKTPMAGFTSLKRSSLWKFRKPKSQGSSEHSSPPPPPDPREGGPTLSIVPNLVSTSSKIAADVANAKEDSREGSSLDAVTGARSGIEPEKSEGARVDDGADQIPRPSLSEPIVEPVPTADGEKAPHSEALETPDAPQTEPLEEDREQAAGLWDLAYDGLREQFPDLIDRYEAIITECLARSEAESNLQEKDVAEMDGPARRVYMAGALDFWLKDAGEAKGDDANPKTAPVEAQSLREIMRVLVRRWPNMSLGWLAACLAIDAILRHELPPDISHLSIVAVISKMEWYISLPKLQPICQDDTEEAARDIIDRRANEFKTSIIALYRTVLYFQILLACSSAENAPLLPQGKSQEGITSGPDEDCPTEADIVRLEQALSKGIDGSEMEIQLCRLLESAHSTTKRDETAKEEVATAQTEEAQLADQLLERLHVVHRPILGPQIGDWRFQYYFSRWATSTSQYLDWLGPSSSRVLWVTGDAGSGKTVLLQALVRRLIDQGAQSEQNTMVAYFFCDSTLKSGGGSSATIMRSLVWQILNSQRSLVKHLRDKLSSTGQDGPDHTSVLNHPNDFYALSTLFCTIIQNLDINTVYFVIDGMEELLDESSNGGSSSDPSVNSSLDSPYRDPYGDRWGLKDILRLIATTSQLSDRVRWLVSTTDAGMKSTVEEQLDIELGHDIGILPNSKDTSSTPNHEELDGPLISDNNNATGLQTPNSEQQEVTNSEQAAATLGQDVKVNEHEVTHEEQLVTNKEQEVTDKEHEGDANNIDRKIPRRPRSTQLQVHVSTTEPEVLRAAEIYTSLKVRALAHKDRYNGKLQVQVREKLRKGSSGNLLWVNIASEMIESQSVPWNAPRLLDNLPTGIWPLYAKMRAKLQGELWEEDRERSNLVLSIASVAFRPLTVDELADIVYTPVENLVYLSAEVDLDVLISKMCFPFLEVVESKVVFKHSAARDYLRKDMKDKEELSQAHVDIIRRCLQSALRPQQHQSSVNENTGSTSYAIISWIRHLSEVQISHVAVVLKSVNEFLQGHFLAWVEALASQRLIGQAREHLQITEAVLMEKAAKALSLDDSGNQGIEEQQDIRDIPILLQQIRVSIWFLNFHESFHGPDYLSPRNSLLFCPRHNELKELLSSEQLPPGLAMAPSIESPGEETDTFLHELTGHVDYVRDCAYSPDGRLIASASDDGSVRLWESETGKVQHIVDSSFVGYVYQVAFSPAHKGLMAATDALKIQLWHTSTGALAETLQVQFETRHIETRDIAFSPRGDYLVAFTDKSVVAWHLPSYQQRQWVDLEAAQGTGDLYLRCGRFSSDGRLLAWATSAGRSASVRYQTVIWDVESARTRHLLAGHEDYINDVVFSPDSSLLASGSNDYTARIWSVETGQMLHVLDARGDWVTALAFSPDGLRLASGSDSYVRIWKATASVADTAASDAREFQLENVLKGHRRHVTAVCFSPSGRHLLSASKDWTLRTWRVDSIDHSSVAEKDSREEPPEPAAGDQGESLQQMSPRRHAGSVSFIASSPDGTMVASASFDGLILLWDANEGTLLRALVGGHDRDIKSLAFSQDGSLLVSACNDHTIGLWNTRSGELIHKLDGHSDWVRYAVISPDGRYVASASDDRTARVWDIQPVLNSMGSNEALDKVNGNHGKPDFEIKGRVLSKHEDYVFCAAFSPDGQYLATAGDERRILIWDLWDLASDEGKRKGSGDDQQNHRQQQQQENNGALEEEAVEGETEDVEDGEKPYAELSDDDKLTDYVRGLVFVPPDGKMLVSVTLNGTVHIWKRTLAASPQQQQQEQEQKQLWDWQCIRAIVANNGSIEAERLAWGRRRFRYLHIDPDHPDVLLSEYGALPLRLSSSDALESSTAPPEWCRYGVRREREDDESRTWITRDDKNFIFLPGPYRPGGDGPCSCQVQGRKVVIGCDSGEVLIFGFADDHHATKQQQGGTRLGRVMW